MARRNYSNIAVDTTLSSGIGAGDTSLVVASAIGGADHTGLLDHGAGLTGLGDDDHTIYLKEEASGGLASEVPDHTHASGAQAGTVAHSVLTGLTNDEHTQYLKEEASGGVASEVPDHTHASGAQAGVVPHSNLSGLTNDEHTQYLKEKASGGTAAEVPNHTHDASGEGGVMIAPVDVGSASDGGSSPTLTSSFVDKVSVTFTKPASWTTYDIIAWGTALLTITDGATTVEARAEIGANNGTYAR
jgi:hypothetical protein